MTSLGPRHLILLILGVVPRSIVSRKQPGVHPPQYLHFLTTIPEICLLRKQDLWSIREVLEPRVPEQHRRLGVVKARKEI